MEPVKLLLDKSLFKKAKMTSSFWQIDRKEG